MTLDPHHYHNAAFAENSSHGTKTPCWMAYNVVGKEQKDFDSYKANILSFPGPLSKGVIIIFKILHPKLCSLLKTHP